MGSVCLKQKRLKHEDPIVLAAQTNFNEAEIEALSGLFRRLSSSLTDDGLISKEEFQLGLFKNSKKKSLIADRMFELFDSKKDGVIEFVEFVHSLSVFHPAASNEEKIAFSFQLFDIWNSGFIEREEIKELILALLDESELILPDELVEAIIDKTFENADSKRDGKIDIEEWEEFVSRNPSLLRSMTIPYLKYSICLQSLRIKDFNVLKWLRKETSNKKNDEATLVLINHSLFVYQMLYQGLNSQIPIILRELHVIASLLQ